MMRFVPIELNTKKSSVLIDDVDYYMPSFDDTVCVDAIVWSVNGGTVFVCEECDRGCAWIDGKERNEKSDDFSIKSL